MNQEQNENEMSGIYENIFMCPYCLKVGITEEESLCIDCKKELDRENK